MAVLRIKYVQAFTDPWGHQRLYFRHKGYKKVSLRGPVGSVEFNEDYALAPSQALWYGKGLLLAGIRVF